MLNDLVQDGMDPRFYIEGVLFGMNCVLYAFCLYTLWGQKSISCGLLLFTNTVQFLLCTIQVILHTILYFIVFAVLVGNIKSYFSHVNAYIVGHTVLFNISFIIAGILSIWHLYVLYDNSIRVCVPAFLIWIAQICASAITIHICATTPLNSTSFNPISMLLWALITVLNFCVAIPICIRLCVAQKTTHTTLSPSLYKSTAIVLVESGALITACGVAMMILYACNYVYALVSLGIATEIAVASQFLTTARHGMLSHGRSTSSVMSTLDASMTQMGSSRTEPTQLVEPKGFASIAKATSRNEKGWQSLPTQSTSP